jgi:hypothetical protein
MNRIYPAQNLVQWWVLVKSGNKLPGSMKVGKGILVSFKLRCSLKLAFLQFIMVFLYYRSKR